MGLPRIRQHKGACAPLGRGDAQPEQAASAQQIALRNLYAQGTYDTPQGTASDELISASLALFAASS